jgi:hypothetical protein
MYYQDVKYNIPITIWLLESYPRNAPLVYVTPTRDMIIKPRHPFVNPSGMVSAPYLQGWVYPRSNLVELVKKLSLIFGDDPPLYSRPAQMPVRPPPPAPMSHHPPQSPSPFMNPMHTGTWHQRLSRHPILLLSHHRGFHIHHTRICLPLHGPMTLLRLLSRQPSMISPVVCTVIHKR